ncbi:MAG: MBL fold metallo-hydrolase [Bacteroidetes bacterium]|nr:MBL fold metallo-hydrolase [Bacteroidota bacterium]
MQRITDKIYQISLAGVNAFLIDDNGLTLVDTGFKNNTDKIFSAIKTGGKNPEDIKQIILTHCHLDHTGSVAEIKRRLGVPIYAHSIDADLIEQGIAGRQPFHISPGIMNWLLFNILIKPTGNTIEPVNIDERLKDNDIIPIAGGIQVIHTPGHSDGHISLLLRSEGVLIAADICANVVGLGLSVLYEDPKLCVSSIMKTASFDFDKAVFGHGKLLAGQASKRLREKFS